MSLVGFYVRAMKVMANEVAEDDSLIEELVELKTIVSGADVDRVAGLINTLRVKTLTKRCGEFAQKVAVLFSSIPPLAVGCRNGFTVEQKMRVHTMRAECERFHGECNDWLEENKNRIGSSYEAIVAVEGVRAKARKVFDINMD